MRRIEEVNNDPLPEKCMEAAKAYFDNMTTECEECEQQEEQQYCRYCLIEMKSIAAVIEGVARKYADAQCDIAVRKYADFLFVDVPKRD